MRPEAAPGLSTHFTARLNAINLDRWIDTEQLAKKAAIPFPDNQRGAGIATHFQPSDARALQSAAKGDRLQQSINPRDAIEIHALEEKEKKRGQQDEVGHGGSLIRTQQTEMQSKQKCARRRNGAGDQRHNVEQREAAAQQDE